MTDQGIQPDERIASYQLVRRLGAGRIGEVWLARDTTLDRDVAIKLLPESAWLDKEAAKRFLGEARTVAALNDPNVVRIYQIGRHGQRIFVVMELVDGGSLGEALKGGAALPWPEATKAVRDAAAGLAAAHKTGLVLRDIKPSNLLRTSDGVVKVVDFGLAQAASDTAGGTAATPVYMSPERGRGRKADARSDLYSLTCTYYVLLTGQVPFRGASAEVLLYQHAHEPFPDPRRIVKDIPAAVCAILGRGAQKAPADRYQRAGDMVRDLDVVLAGYDAQADDPDEGGRVKAIADVLAKRKTILTLLGLVALILASLGLGLLLGSC